MGVWIILHWGNAVKCFMVKNGMKLSEKEFAHLLIEAMPMKLQIYLLNK